MTTTPPPGPAIPPYDRFSTLPILQLTSSDIAILDAAYALLSIALGNLVISTLLGSSSALSKRIDTQPGLEMLLLAQANYQRNLVARQNGQNLLKKEPKRKRKSTGKAKYEDPDEQYLMSSRIVLS